MNTEWSAIRPPPFSDERWEQVIPVCAALLGLAAAGIVVRALGRDRPSDLTAAWVLLLLATVYAVWAITHPRPTLPSLVGFGPAFQLIALLWCKNSGFAAHAAAYSKTPCIVSVPRGSVFGVGRYGLSAKKDQATLLNAFTRLVETPRSAVLVIAGDGPLRRELEHAADGFGLTGSVRFLGSHDDVDESLPAFDVFTLSSAYEGLPISLLEAMAAEVACFTTAVGDIPEAVRSGVQAELVPAGGPEALCDALHQALSNDARRVQLARAGRRRVEAAFSIDNAINRTCADYERALRLAGQ